MRKMMAALGALVRGLTVLVISTSSSWATDFPSRPVTVVVGYAAGGPTDVLMRAIAPRLAEEWKVPVIVDNRPGTNETIAAQLVSKARSDGHTLLLSSEAPLTQNQHLYAKLPFNPEADFSPITHVLTSPLVLVVHPGVPADTAEQFIALAKKRGADQPLAYGSSGPGGVLHLPMAVLAKQYGLSMTHVPYKGLAPLINDLLGRQIDAAWMAVAAAAPLVQTGKLKALVLAAPEKSAAIPAVPLLRDTSIKPFQANFIFALTAPAGTPLSVRTKIADGVRRVLADPGFRQQYLDPYGFIAVTSTPEALADYLVKDRPLQAERIKISGVSLE